eukprot:gene11667-11810_t
MHQVAMDHDMADDDDETAAAPAAKRQKAEGVAYRTVSGKVWKDEAEKRASADKNAVLGTSWDKKMREKALRKAFLEQKAAAQDAAKEKRKAAAQHRQAVKDRKKANQEKSAQVQKVRALCFSQFFLQLMERKLPSVAPEGNIVTLQADSHAV